jgi:signal transduction histidine kinase
MALAERKSEISDDLEEASRHFTVDARAMLTWGRDSIKDHTTAVLELVKNSYDAGATVVEVMIQVQNLFEQFVRIADDGVGMSNNDVSTKWLRIGYSEKLVHKKMGTRRKTGEKGIGRISADRLGSVLELRTQSGSDEPVGLRVNWQDFESSGPNLEDIAIPDLEDLSFLVPQPAPFNKRAGKYGEPPPSTKNSRTHTGAELTIRQLRQQWTRSDVEVLHRELSILTSPFGGVRDFQVRLVNDIAPEFDGTVQSPFFRKAEIEAKFKLLSDDRVRFQFIERDRHGKPRPRRASVVKWDQFVHLVPHREEEPAAKPNFGPAIVHLLFYPQTQETLRGTNFTIADLKEFLEHNAGIKVYRDNIRVFPYGDPRKPEGDWLGLGMRKARDPAGPARPTWKVAPNQIVGGVFLGRDTNPEIVDTSGREGLIHGEQFIGLRAFIFGCLFSLESHYHRAFLQRRAEQPPPPSPRRTVREFDEGLRTLAKELRRFEQHLPKDGERAAQRVRAQLTLSLSRVGQLKRSIDELASQATIYRGLSTLGIALATFGHEIEASLDQFMTSAHAAHHLLMTNPPSLNTAIDELLKSIAAGKRVSTWGAYAIRRIKPEKRQQRLVRVDEIIEDLIGELKPAFDASSITIKWKVEKAQAETFGMDIESVIVNLLTNAYYFSKQNRKPRAVNLMLRNREQESVPGFQVIVSDSGPGVSEKMRTRIWEPLVSTKVDRNGNAEGTGLGLSIVDAVVKDMGGTRGVDRDPNLGGARFTVWLPVGD